MCGGEPGSLLQQDLERGGQPLRHVERKQLVPLGRAANLVEVLLHAKAQSVDVDFPRAVTERLEQ
jgi:hypothetical protein